MIWLIAGILILAVLLFVTKPLYMKEPPVAVQDTEITDYLLEITQIDEKIDSKRGDAEALEAAKLELQRGLLASKSKPVLEDKGPSFVLLASIFVVFSFVTFGLYAMLGRWELTVAGNLQKPVLAPVQTINQNTENNIPLDQLVALLEEKLKGDGNTAEGWILYARSLMNLGRYDDALKAYDKVVELSGRKSGVVSELEQAKEFIAQRRASAASPQASGPLGPSEDDIRAAASMSAKDRQAMIENMVEGLSQKLIDGPNNPDAWVRLLRARSVLGHKRQGEAEVRRMRDTYKNAPETITQILTASGWEEN